MDQKEILKAIKKDAARSGEIKKLAKEIKVNHKKAKTFWAAGNLQSRMLATLLFDKKLIDQDFIDQWAADLTEHDDKARNQLSEWFLANQLMKNKKTVALIQGWQDHASPTLRRLFWYHQARLRWTGQEPPENTGDLMKAIEKGLSKEVPEVQWTMNFCAAWIGIHDSKYRKRVVQLGKKVGLYKEEKPVKNCTPNYLPEFVRIEVEKRK
jgi:3-methyladenine DNA glycosylase AlkD